MHCVSGAIHGVLVLSKIKYPIASEGLRPPVPLLQRSNTEGSYIMHSVTSCLDFKLLTFKNFQGGESRAKGEWAP